MLALLKSSSRSASTTRLNLTARTPVSRCLLRCVVSTMALMDGPDFQPHAGSIQLLPRRGLSPSASCTPVHYSRLRWQKEGEREATGLVVSRLFRPNRFVEKWRFGRPSSNDDVVPFEGATLSPPLSAISQRPSLMPVSYRRSREPQPTAEACELAPRFIRWRDLAAFLLMIRAERSA